MGLIANCDRCECTQLGSKGLPAGWDFDGDELLCPKCQGKHMLPKEPHPITGEPFTVVVHVTDEVEVHSYRIAPPVPPFRVVQEYDDEGEVIDTRQLSDEEYEADCRAYDAALKQYQKTGGVLNAPGKKTVSGRFRCPSGAWVEGFWDGDRWLWSKVAGAAPGHRICPRCEADGQKMANCQYCRGKGALKVRDAR